MAHDVTKLVEVVVASVIPLFDPVVETSTWA